MAEAKLPDGGMQVARARLSFWTAPGCREAGSHFCGRRSAGQPVAPDRAVEQRYMSLETLARFIDNPVGRLAVVA